MCEMQREFTEIEALLKFFFFFLQAYVIHRQPRLSSVQPYSTESACKAFLFQGGTSVFSGIYLWATCWPTNWRQHLVCPECVQRGALLLRRRLSPEECGAEYLGSSLGAVPSLYAVVSQDRASCTVCIVSILWWTGSLPPPSFFFPSVLIDGNQTAQPPGPPVHSSLMCGD